MDDLEIVKEFILETTENLDRLELDLVQLEERPKDVELLGSIFRTFHTVKGTCGFLGFSSLESLAHAAENLLSRLRNGELDISPAIVSLILQSVDATRAHIAALEAEGTESAVSYEDLKGRLELAASGQAPTETCQSEPEPEPEPAAVEAASPATLTAPVKSSVAEPVAKRPESPVEQVTQVKSDIADSSIRVDVALLDKLMNLVGELVLARNQIIQFKNTKEDAGFNITSQRLNLITTELQGNVMKTRMQPIGVVWNKLPRLVRDLAASEGKQINLTMEGADTELDKTIIEAIKDPLIHIVRNSCDHGIEKPAVRLAAGKPATGTLSLRAYHEGGQVNIEIKDDGKGLDPVRIKAKAVEKGLLRADQADQLSEREVLNLIFAPGFSTAERVTSVSGRGVGMDVVRTNLERTGGVADLFSQVNVGTTIKIKIPLTLAIIPGLVVTVDRLDVNGKEHTERFAIPQVSLLELIRLDGDGMGAQIESIHGTPVYRRRGKLLPIAYLCRCLALTPKKQAGPVNIVVLQTEDQQFGLVVDGIRDTQEIVVKPLSKYMKGLGCYAGATIMGDGKVALILDIPGLGKMAGVLGQTAVQQHDNEAEKKRLADEAIRAQHQTLLIVKAGQHDRLAIPLDLVARLEVFPLQRVERAGGTMAVQYRDTILPLAAASEVLEGIPGSAYLDRPELVVVVVNDGRRAVGIIVDAILDITEDIVTAKTASTRKGLLGCGIVGNKMVDFLDLQAILTITESRDARHAAAEMGMVSTVLVADESTLTRSSMRSDLEFAGYRVLEASNLEESLQRLDGNPVDVIAIDVSLPGGGIRGLLSRLGKRGASPRPAVVGLASTSRQLKAKWVMDELGECQLKRDRESVMDSISRLAAAVDDLQDVNEEEEEEVAL